MQTAYSDELGASNTPVCSLGFLVNRMRDGKVIDPPKAVQINIESIECNRPCGCKEEFVVYEGSMDAQSRLSLTTPGAIATICKCAGSFQYC